MPQPSLPSPIAAEEIFRVAAALPAAERAAYLAAACEGQPAVRARLERMLQAHEIGAFLQQGADDPGAAEIEAELASVQPEQAGERIGHYELIERLGEGGFGVVWVAAQERPVRRQVALKIIKLGMDTREVIARFEQERQALALMDHPGIAKVFDAGATPTGRPYFVMELVHGVPITDYCDRERLPTADRLRLFIAVCQAVQHAHQKGIIHRDLKPSNILVAVQDGVAVPKVIDFGVAKATQQQRLSELTVQTGVAQMIGTPLYMAPEQAELSALDIDTRADIYALGVLLYELLTGRTPFDPEALMRHGWEEMRRTIREQEPPKPSTALHTMAAAARTTVAQRRQVDGARLIGQLRGDLDWIVMKALEKDRTRRYETANDFALDVRRHLASEPVAARAPSFGYQAGKFVRRNRRVVVAASAVFLALLAGLIASTVLYLREKTAWTSEAAQRQRAEVSAQLAETEAGNARAQTALAERNAEAEAAARKEAEAIATFLTEGFQSPDPKRDGRTITVAEILERAVAKLETDLASHPARRASLQATLAKTYQALGLDRDAIPLREKVRDFHLAASGPEHGATVSAIANLAKTYSAAGRLGEAIPMLQETLAHYRRVLGPEHLDTLLTMGFLANSYAGAGRHAEALELREEVLALRRKLVGPEHPDTLDAMIDLGRSYADVGRRAEALKLREEVLQLNRKLLGPEHPYTLIAMNNLAGSYADAGRQTEALKLREDVLPLQRKVLGPEHPDTLRGMSNLARSYAATGRQSEALKLREEVLALRRTVLGPEHPDTLLVMHNLASSYADAGRWDEALTMEEEVLTLRRKVLGAEHPNTLMAMYNLAISYTNAGRQADALKLQEEGLRLRRKVLGPEHPDTLRSMNNLGISYANAERRDDALKLQEELLPLRHKVLGPEHPDTLGAMTNLASSYRRAGRIQDAIELQEKALEIKRRVLPPQHSFLRAAITNLADCYAAAGRAGEAEALRKELATLQK